VLNRVEDDKGPSARIAVSCMLYSSASPDYKTIYNYIVVEYHALCSEEVESVHVSLMVRQ